MKVFMIADLAWGDCGKGSSTDWLCRQHDIGLVVRYNGGPQAAHNVITPDGRQHTFAQFGSGTFIPGVCTYLSHHTLINPIDMIAEELHLRSVGVEDAFDRLFVDMNCTIITPFQRAANRLLEISRGNGRHGSCGQGVGEARFDELRHGLRLRPWDLCNGEEKKLMTQIQALNREKIMSIIDSLPDTDQVKDELAILQDPNAINWCLGLYDKWLKMRGWTGIVETEDVLDYFDGDVVFEGAQGVLLDETHGDAPYNTWTDTTFNNAETILDELEFKGIRTRIGVIRAYMTRHGAGPFPTEDKNFGKLITEQHNETGQYQGAFRFGHFDPFSILRALKICGGVDEIYMNCIDQLPLKCLPCHPDYYPDGFVDDVEEVLNTPITMVGWGPQAKDKKVRVSQLQPKNSTMSAAS